MLLSDFVLPHCRVMSPWTSRRRLQHRSHPAGEQQMAWWTRSRVCKSSPAGDVHYIFAVCHIYQRGRAGICCDVSSFILRLAMSVKYER